MNTMNTTDTQLEMPITAEDLVLDYGFFIGRYERSLNNLEISASHRADQLSNCNKSLSVLESRYVAITGSRDSAQFRALSDYTLAYAAAVQQRERYSSDLFDLSVANTCTREESEANLAQLHSLQLDAAAARRELMALIAQYGEVAQ